MIQSTVRIFIVDDHALVRKTVADQLDREAGLSVVGVADSPERAIAHSLPARPDIILMDIDLDGKTSYTAARLIGAMQPQVRIIFFSGYVYDRYIQAALDAGASGYISKCENWDRVVGGIRSVATGGQYFSPEVLNRVIIDENGIRVMDSSPPRTRLETLTERERQVLIDIASGLPKKSIAHRLSVSIKTVEKHCDHLMQKLDIHDRVELARFAIREELTSLFMDGALRLPAQPKPIDTDPAASTRPRMTGS